VSHNCSTHSTYFCGLLLRQGFLNMYKMTRVKSKHSYVKRIHSYKNVYIISHNIVNSNLPNTTSLRLDDNEFINQNSFICETYKNIDENCKYEEMELLFEWNLKKNDHIKLITYKLRIYIQ